jgi:hypothetical protein
MPLIIALTAIRHKINKTCFLQEHLGAPIGPDGSEGTSYLPMVIKTRHIAHVTGHIAYLFCAGYCTTSHIVVMRRVVYCPVDSRYPGIPHPCNCIRNVVTDLHPKNDTRVPIFAGAPVKLQPVTHLRLWCMRLSGQESHLTFLLLLFIG